MDGVCLVSLSVYSSAVVIVSCVRLYQDDGDVPSLRDVCIIIVSSHVSRIASRLVSVGYVSGDLIFSLLPAVDVLYRRCGCACSVAPIHIAWRVVFASVLVPLAVCET